MAFNSACDFDTRQHVSFSLSANYYLHSCSKTLLSLVSCKEIFASLSVPLAMRYKAYLFLQAEFQSPGSCTDTKSLTASLLRDLLIKVIKHLLYLYEWFALLKSGTCWYMFLSAVTH